MQYGDGDDNGMHPPQQQSITIYKSCSSCEKEQILELHNKWLHAL